MKKVMIMTGVLILLVAGLCACRNSNTTLLPEGYILIHRDVLDFFTWADQQAQVQVAAKSIPLGMVKFQVGVQEWCYGTTYLLKKEKMAFWSAYYFADGKCIFYFSDILPQCEGEWDIREDFESRTKILFYHIPSTPFTKKRTMGPLQEAQAKINNSTLSINESNYRGY